MDGRSETVSMTELLRNPSEWIGKTVTTSGYFVVPHIYVGPMLREQRYETIDRYVARCRAASLEVYIGYLVDIPDITGPEPWHLVDEQKSTFLISDWWLFSQKWQALWALIRPIYRSFRQSSSLFAKTAIEVDLPILSSLIDISHVGIVLFSAYTHKFPARVTGVFSYSEIPQFKVQMKDISELVQIEHQVRRLNREEIDIFNSIEQVR